LVLLLLLLGGGNANNDGDGNDALGALLGDSGFSNGEALSDNPNLSGRGITHSINGNR